ncbi:hypothetical protein CMQ_3421 [Grosmannia clavigera kw1407]|uniref:Uncharacterized protein n=1 Tax=Grosmannia clavigera (strain kw1407 / UAMH 11150) TaxID=655863 RepID=F0XA44_GROCL|nr:uncharacterized protein CMQ_3421 [Grosmannia clavigera kw1407]EFX05352.1 hypothetical protein CMQ_3421 [Grosmannia clavigera kw1407]
MAQSTDLKPAAATADEPAAVEESNRPLSTAQYSVLRARLDLGDGQTDEGEGEDIGRRRLGGLLAKKRASPGDATAIGATATATVPQVPAFRPSDPNDGLGMQALDDADTTADGKTTLRPHELLLPLGGQAAAGPTTNRRARQLMVAPKAAMRGKPGGKMVGWQNGKTGGTAGGPNGRPNGSGGRGYESSSDDEAGRSSLGRKKVRKG